MIPFLWRRSQVVLSGASDRSTTQKKKKTLFSEKSWDIIW